MGATLECIEQEHAACIETWCDCGCHHALIDAHHDGAHTAPDWRCQECVKAARDGTGDARSEDMTDEQIERVRADVGRRWGALETAVEDAAVEVDAEGQNGNLVRRAFEETRAAVEGEIEALTASNERLRQERNAAVTAADLAPVYEALEADNEHALAAKVQAAAQTIERLTARLATAEKAAHEWRERAGRVAESSWDKAHVEAAFKAFWVDGAREHTNSAGAWADLRARIEAEEAGA